MAVTYPCYWEKKDASGYWYWIYYASNAEEIARSSESYVDRSDCTHSIKGNCILDKAKVGSQCASSVTGRHLLRMMP